MTFGLRLTRWLAIAALTVATGAMFLISLRGNYLYGYGLGQTDEKRFLFAWANVAADVWKAFGLVAIGVLWRARHWRVALVGSIAWCVCLLSGINSAIAVYVEDRAALTGERASKHADYRDAERELANIEARYVEVASARSIGELDALIAASLAQSVVFNDRVRGTVGKLSFECRTPDARTAEACAEVGRLRAERARAEEAARLQARADILRLDIVRLRSRGSAAPDPIGEFYTWATRGLVSVRDVGFGFPLFFAFMIEVVTAFGPITVVRFAELSATPLATSDATWRVASRQIESRLVTRHVDEHVASWMSDRARPHANATTTLHDLHRDYERWCKAQGLPGCDAGMFGSAFDRLRGMPELCGKIRKFGTRYYGVGVDGAEDARS